MDANQASPPHVSWWMALSPEGEKAVYEVIKAAKAHVRHNTDNGLWLALLETVDALEAAEEG